MLHDMHPIAQVLIGLAIAIGYLCLVCVCLVCIAPLCRRDPEGPSTTDKLLVRAALLRLFGCAFGPATASALGTIAPAEPPV
jgi:hypothetical protein